jgi:PPP family 3-phenylpropionic acid transporter
MTLSHLGDRTDAYGRIRLWGSVGFILMVVGLGYAFDFVAISWLPWAVLAVMLGIVAFARVIPEAEILPHSTDQHSGWDIVKRPEVASLLAACLLMAVTHGPYYTFYSIYLVDHGYDKSTAGWLWALGVLCEIGIFLIVPRIFARVTPRRLILASFALAVLRSADRLGVESAWVWGAQTACLTFGTYHAAAVALITSISAGATRRAGRRSTPGSLLRRRRHHRRLASGLTCGHAGVGLDIFPGCREAALAWATMPLGEYKTVPRQCPQAAMK